MHKKYQYDGLMFDSSIEIAYYIYMKDHKTEILRANTSFQYEFDGKIWHYIPDFYLPQLDQYVEIKGDHFFKEDGTMHIPWKGKQDDEKYRFTCEKAKAKHQCMISNNIKIIKQSDIEMKNALQYINSKYGKKYLKQFK